MRAFGVTSPVSGLAAIDARRLALVDAATAGNKYSSTFGLSLRRHFSRLSGWLSGLARGSLVAAVLSYTTLAAALAATLAYEVRVVFLFFLLVVVFLFSFFLIFFIHILILVRHFVLIFVGVLVHILLVVLPFFTFVNGRVIVATFRILIFFVAIFFDVRLVVVLALAGVVIGGGVMTSATPAALAESFRRPFFFVRSLTGISKTDNGASFIINQMCFSELN